MSGDYVELFWALLECGNLDKLKQSIPKDFCWNTLHPQNKTTILVEACDFPIDGRNENDILDLIEWLAQSGASFTQKCGECADMEPSFVLFEADKAETKMEVTYAGHSLLSYIKAWEEQLCGKKYWERERAFLNKVVDRLGGSFKQNARPRASIDEGIVEIWEKFLHTASSHDLTIQTQDGCVTCHAQMLMAASPVVQAMLASPMQEGTSKKIRLEDTSSSAAQLFLEVLYTCSSQSDPINWKIALAALDLAHRWQVEAVVAILSDLLHDMISAESFSAIAEQAALKGLDLLMQQCQKFAATNATIKKQIKKGQLPKVVQKLFQADPPKAPAAKKRKRL